MATLQKTSSNLLSLEVGSMLLDRQTAQGRWRHDSTLHSELAPSSTPAFSRQKVLVILLCLVSAAVSTGCSAWEVDDAVLRDAIGKKDEEAFLREMKKGFSPDRLNRQEGQGYTILHSAAISGLARSVKALVDAGVKADLQTKELETPLLLAAGTGKLETVRVLLELGAKPDGPEGDILSPLMVAAGTGNTDIMNALIAKRASVNLRQRNATAIDVAVGEGKRDAVALLLDSGATYDPLKVQFWKARKLIPEIEKLFADRDPIARGKRLQAEANRLQAEYLAFMKASLASDHLDQRKNAEYLKKIKDNMKELETFLYGDGEVKRIK